MGWTYVRPFISRPHSMFFLFVCFRFCPMIQKSSKKTNRNNTLLSPRGGADDPFLHLSCRGVAKQSAPWPIHCLSTSLSGCLKPQNIFPLPKTGWRTRVTRKETWRWAEMNLPDQTIINPHWTVQCVSHSAYLERSQRCGPTFPIMETTFPALFL